MNITEHLAKLFPESLPSARDMDIEARPNLMDIRDDIDLLVAVPAYMLWCTRHPYSPELISTFTLHALGEYGRCKSPENAYLNFLYRCSPEQRAAVVLFLEWASEAVPFHHRETVERALRNWKNLDKQQAPGKQA